MAFGLTGEGLAGAAGVFAVAAGLAGEIAADVVAGLEHG